MPAILTWLDWYCADAHKTFKSMPIPDEIKKQFAANIKTAKDAMSFIASGTIENTAPPKDEHELTLRLMYCCIIPFISTETKLPPAGAIRLSRELALDFSGAEPPENDDYKFMLRSKTWYFDIPQRTIFVGPAQVRAIFCQPSGDSNIVIVSWRKLHRRPYCVALGRG